MKLSDFRYIVSWNNDFIGDHHLKTIDFIGNDIQQLIDEVIKDNPEFVWVPREADWGEGIVGNFLESAAEIGQEDQCAPAMMFDTTVVDPFDA